MIEKIAEGISAKLNEEFGNEYSVYTEQVEQGFENPCFFIQCINPASTPVLGNRYFRSNPFCIQYFPVKSESKSECYSIQDALFTVLEYITVDGGLQRGTKMRGEFTDGVLSFFVNYDMYVYKVDKKIPMKELKHNINLKG